MIQGALLEGKNTKKAVKREKKETKNNQLWSKLDIR